MALETAIIETLHHYLNRAAHLLEIVARRTDAEALLAGRLAPDALEVGLNIAIAQGFAARALCLPAGRPVPQTPEPCTLSSLTAFRADVEAAIAGLGWEDLASPVTHVAGEATLTQSREDYVVRYALPNMIFHLSMAYAALRGAGVPLGKADFDGMHVYT